MLMDKKEKEDASLLHSFNDVSEKFSFSRNLLIVLGLVAILGIGSGYMLSTTKTGNQSSVSKSENSSTNAKGTIIGSEDTKTFRDPAEGVLQEGGIDGEGQYHLDRPGGESQRVYMTSSIIDLSQFVGKKVKVWGETQTAKKAGWLMDVGRVQVL